MIYIVISICQLIFFVTLDLLSLMFLFKPHRFNKFYYKNASTDYIVESGSQWNKYTEGYYKNKYSALFMVGKMNRNIFLG